MKHRRGHPPACEAFAPEPWLPIGKHRFEYTCGMTSITSRGVAFLCAGHDAMVEAGVEVHAFVHGTHQLITK